MPKRNNRFPAEKAAKPKTKLGNKILRNWQLYLLILLPLLHVLVFRYYPMYGAQIAFKKFIASKGILGSPWIGFTHFIKFFTSYDFSRTLINTLVLSVYGLVAGFPIPIILAIALNYADNRRFKKYVQMITYAPHFISTVVMVSIIQQFFSMHNGIISNLITFITGKNENLLGVADYFRSIYVWSGVWKSAGYGSIIYLAALAGIDMEQHEAAIIDGATKPQRIWHIDIPGILPTAIVLLILNMGEVLDTGFEKILLMQNPLNLRVSEVIDSFVYKVGIASEIANYSYSTAVGLFKSAVGFALVVSVNHIAKKLGETSLW
ncbi:MAG: ABC transporter permease subunit [Treponema sp.]|nr:ABC transporter permease subunit [Treponema sp.]